MRALFLSTLPIEGPSARPRLYAYERALRAAGIEPVFAPLLSSDTARRFYAAGPAARGRRLAAAASGALRRLARLCRAGSFDVVVVHRDILPRGNRLALSVLRRAGVPIVYDFDDAIYLSPRDFVGRGQASRRLMARGKDPGEVGLLVEAADVVLAGNETIASWARERSDDVRIQPTPVDTDRFRPRIRVAECDALHRPVVGWIGSPTATYCLTALAEPLARVARETPFTLRVVGAGEALEIPGVEVDQQDWSLEREPEQYASLDVGLYPLPDNEWTRGKCGYKALVYMACEVVPVASPVGVNRELVGGDAGGAERGFHASTDEEWVAGLSRLLGDPPLRARMGAAGREHVERHYSVRALEEPFVRACRDAADKRRATGAATR